MRSDAPPPPRTGDTPLTLSVPRGWVPPTAAIAALAALLVELAEATEFEAEGRGPAEDREQAGAAEARDLAGEDVA